MVGITLSADEIHKAPPEVRRWLEQQVGAVFGPSQEPTLHPPGRHLAGCSPEQAQAVLSMIQGMLPVVGVFFALGREPVAMGAHGLLALRLDDIARHTHLQAPEQVVRCLETIDAAFQRVSGQPDAALTALDDAGHCVLADTTARRIRALWHEIVEARTQAHNGFVEPQVAYVPQPFQTPYPIPAPPAPAQVAQPADA